MTFPATPTPLKTELYYSAAWNDITSDVRGPISISRGQQSEQSGSSATPSRMTFNLNNRTGKYSPRNPNSVLYGLIGRNTEIRTYIELGTPRALFLSTSDFFTAPDSAALSITGDIDLRTDIDLPTWRPFEDTYLGINKVGSYLFYVDTTGYLHLLWNDSGAVEHNLASTEPVPGSTVGRKAVRVTMDVNNGAAGKTLKFYYSDTLGDLTGASWTQIGSDVIEAGTTSIINSANLLIVDSFHEDTELFDIEIRDGIAGTIVAKPAFTTRTNGATSFSDSYSNTYTGAVGGVVTNRHYLFNGNVPAWPQRWDVTGSDIWVPIEAAGPLRRLGQGSSPVDSPYKVGALRALPNCISYWPMEDGEAATRFDKGIGTRFGTWAGTPVLATDSSFACSKPLPTVESASFNFPITPYTNTGENQVRFLAKIPDSTPTGTVIMRVRTNSTCARYDLVYNTGGSLQVNAYNHLDVLITTIGPSAFAIDGLPLRIGVSAFQNGADVDFTISTLAPGAAVGSYYTATASACTLGASTRVEINPNKAACVGVVVGHITAETLVDSVFSNASQLAAYNGELAQQRIYRICDENAINAHIVGYHDDGQYMGTQPISSLLDVVYEAAAVDGGILYEQQDRLGLGFRTLNSLYNQDAVLTIAYTDNNLQSFEPTEDDQHIRNKVTVTRKDSSSATVEDTTSPLSTSDAPAGVGVYDEATTLALWKDIQTEHQAGWRVHVGTVDEARFPQISINLAHPDYASSNSQLMQALSVDIGDRIDVTGMPSWLPPEDVQQVVMGQTIVLNNFECSITYNCRPFRPFRAVKYNGKGVDRYSNEYTTVDGSHNSSTTTLSVDVPYGPLWTDTDGDFDIMVAGERMTVTAISGASSPQSFTVTRSVNGVSKSHADGESVQLYDPTYFGL